MTTWFRKKRTIKLLLVLTIYIFFQIFSLNIYSLEAKQFQTTNSFIILSDDDFSRYSFPGDGSAGNPFIIENHSFLNTKEFGILISNTTKYIIIRHNSFASNTYGIHIEYTKSSTINISYNIFSASKSSGIDLINVDNATIARNSIFNSGIDGITVYGSEYTNISNNNIYNSKDYGIFSISSPNSYIFGNRVINSGYDDINIFRSENSSIINNDVTNGGFYGISTIFSPNSKLLFNKFTNAGWYFDEVSINNYNYYIEGNIVNNKPLVVLMNMNNVQITNNDSIGQLVLINSYNVIISNVTISNTDTAFLVDFSHNILIENSNVHSGLSPGILVRRSYDLSIRETEIYNSSYIGVEILDSSNIIFSNNELISNKKYGLAFNRVENSTIINNYIQENELVGIHFINVENIKVFNNTVSNNLNIAIDLLQSNNILIKNNTILSNNYGIQTLYTSNLEVTENLIANNRYYAIQLTIGSENNAVHHNHFVDNNLNGESQAYDSGKTNNWYDTILLEGNYWSDSIENSIYFVDGTAMNNDSFPLKESDIKESGIPLNTQNSTRNVFYNMEFLLVIPLIYSVSFFYKIKWKIQMKK